MLAKDFSSDRKRSRPVQKRKKTDVFKKNKLASVFLVLIIAIIVVSAVFVLYVQDDDSKDDQTDVMEDFNLDDNGQNDNGQNNNGGNSNGENNYDTDYPVAVLDTSMGNIAIELYADKVPITAGNFIDLAKDGFYDGTKFHRISPGFMIQGGDPNSKNDNPDDDGTGGPGYTIQDEFHPDLKNIRGMISMANSGPDTGGSQFFILVNDAQWLDNAHAVFGRVISGMNVVDNIANAEHDGRFEPSPGGGRPINDIIVYSISIVNE